MKQRLFRNKRTKSEFEQRTERTRTRKPINHPGKQRGETFRIFAHR